METSSKESPTVLPVHVQWPDIYNIDSGGPEATAFARSILRKHKRASAAARLHCHVDWLGPLFKEFNIPRLTVIAWNSIFSDYAKQSPEEQKETYSRLLCHVRALAEKHQPQIVVVDQENACHLLPQLPADVRGIVTEEVGPDVPIYYYYGDLLFGQGTGDAPCPCFYQLWDDEFMSPVDKLYYTADHGSYGMIRTNPDYFIGPENYQVAGGWPWLSPFTRPDDLTSPLVDYDDWIEACQTLKDLGAAGFSMNSTPWSSSVLKHYPGIHHPIHDELMRRMLLGASVWD